MAETINNKPTIQIRSGLPSPLPDKSPSPATKLLLNHGKPNFTISRKEENGNGNVSPQPSSNNNYNAYRSANNNVTTANTNKFIVGTKFNGVFKPSNGLANGNGTSEAENEAAKVVLRRPKLAASPPPAEGEDENVPEFIRRQRRIQERLAKENVLDFENRRSGYFTHVMISPDSPNRTSFVETMASPAIVPALEIPAPVTEQVQEEKEQEEPQAVPVAAAVTSALITKPEPEPVVSNGHSEEVATNGHSEVAPEEVAKAIEEVNKAVAGEEDDKPEAEPVEEVVPATPTSTPVPVDAQVEVVEPVQNGVSTPTEEPTTNGQTEQAVPTTNGQKEEAAPTQNGQKEEEAAPTQNGQKEESAPSENGEKKVEEAITISHTNGQTSDGPSIPAPDPSGALGVNYEPKTVVSFSQELGGGENNYPDTVKVVSDAPAEAGADGELKELTKLKFDIKSDDQNEVQVTPVLRAE
ncbi:hypothetical protein KR067_002192 [Drosophila pandora]|nr:hypothetical protein KR067_002192 [Drosophila pandora]